jgi:AraC family transcriptional regulator, regulatory protein of adaptative response / DNA-3-methyladenine glycosylase II
MRRRGSSCPMRARAISAIAAAVTAGPKLLCVGCSLEDAITRLRALQGAGESTTQYIALRGMHELDAFPAAEVGHMRAANEARIRPNAVDLLARAEAWRPWRVYAAQHLWAASPTAAEKTARSCP